MKRLSAGLVASSLLLLSILVGAQAARPPVDVSTVRQPLVTRSAEAITGAELENLLSFVASDEMEGRLTPSRGLDTTAKFIATLLAERGVKPAGDKDTYFQRIALRRERIVADGAEVRLDGRTFSFGSDFVAPVGGDGSGAMVFAGDGWFVKSKNIDPYAGLDPKGKIVILMQGAMPAGITGDDLRKWTEGEDYMYPTTYARKRGVAAIVLLPPTLQPNPQAMERSRRNEERGSFQPERLRRPSADRVPVISAGVPLAEAIFKGERVDAATIFARQKSGTPVPAFELSPERKLSFTVKTAVDTVDSQNVVAVIEGSDPILKREYVALGAHYDHLGTTTATKGDTIFNGADDDGSGTVALLAIADAVMKAERHPKRSVLFIWHMGEEEGLWGSQYFTTYPTVPLDKVITELNIDMIGRTKEADDTEQRDKDLSGPDEVYVIGSKMMSTDLGEISEAVNASYLKLHFNYKYDDPKDPERFFYRSDHYNYALKGIPIIFYFTGVHADYHQVSDEVSKIDFGKYTKIARTIYATMWELAEAATRPVVDRPLKQ